MNITQPKMHVGNASIPLKNAYGRNFWGDQSVTWPHQCIHDLYHNYPDEFTRRVVPDFTAIRRFWDAMDGSPFVEGHSMCATKGVARHGGPHYHTWGRSLSNGRGAELGEECRRLKLGEPFGIGGNAGYI